ncbi:MAG: hypothetical protein A3K19_03885 [Lentisphaerae bacterium RIFOXYB12_FULL_65_16]|nr:MAG: hypothetical protein A3K18_02980 [Lentisphaerae bacterium RIFOXYA12_64_32]OGV89284.1 MAG: hypothetical protein A3K19_03885 [Lentisphaerae bacterium RIFOXYB12_FULL_65_16]
MIGVPWRSLVNDRLDLFPALGAAVERYSDKGWQDVEHHNPYSSPWAGLAGRCRVTVVLAILTSVVALAGPEPVADQLQVNGGSYAVLRTARHETYDVTLNLKPPAGAPQFEKLDVLVGYADTAPYGRLQWDSSGVRLDVVTPNGTESLVSAPTALFPELKSGGTLVLKRHTRWLELVAAERQVFRVLDERIGKGAVAASAGPGCPQVVDAAYQRVEPILFADDFERTEEEAKSLGSWEPVSGEWRLYSVMEQVKANPDAKIRAGHEPEAERSANPFCLSGKAVGGAMILTGHPFWDDYSFAVSVKPGGGECGLVFGARDLADTWLVRWTLTSLGVAPGRVELVRRAVGQEEALGAAWVPGRVGNWYRMEVRAVGARIEVLIDGAKVLDVRDERCVGGRIGLCMRGENETLFDDVDVRSWAPIELATDADSTSARGAVFGAWGTAMGADDRLAIRVRPAASAGPAIYGLGRPQWPVCRLRAEVAVAAPDAAVGLVFGLADARNYSRVSLVPGQPAQLSFVRVQDGKETTSASVAVAADLRTAHVVEVDPAGDGLLRVWLDGTLEMRESLPGAAGGCVGLWAAGSGTVEFRDVTLFSEAVGDWERPVNVEIFAGDPYMQGWASPRWAWLPAGPEPPGGHGQPGLYRHQGDFYGPFRLKAPVCNGMSLFFGLETVEPEHGYSLAMAVDERAGTGQVRLTRDGLAVREATFPLGEKRVIPGQQIVNENVGALPPTPDTTSFGEWSFERDGKCMWLTVAGKELFSVREDTPLSGRAVGMQIREPLDFLYVSMVRGQLRDYLFEKAAADWVKAGSWEVTNRFACDPRWSHMNGRSRGVAVLWNKLEFPGNFTLEYYAGMGMRQGDLREGAERTPYPRVGDINVALCADGQDLFSGYNLVLGAWDEYWSEKWSQFWRLDTVLDQTDRELIPRTRYHRANVRPIEVEWDPGGRAVHGAWYFVKIRKTGSRFDVSFDNVPVFSVTDPSPLAGRRLALWTQHNSIVVARAKIGYERLVTPAVACAPPPPPAAVWPAAPAAAVATGAEPSTVAAPAEYRFDFEAGTQGWAPFAGDQSAELVCAPGDRAGRGAYSLELRNLHAGGDFGVTLPVNGLDLGRVKAIEMDCCVPPDTAVNLYINLTDEPLEHYVVTLSGPDKDAPNVIGLGRFSPFKPDGTWQHVRFEPGAALWRTTADNPLAWKSALVVHEMVLGMLHEGYLNAGMEKNKQGATYRIDNVRIELGDPAQALTVAETRPREGGAWGGEPVVVRFGLASGAHPVLAATRLTVSGKAVPVGETNTRYDPVTRELSIDLSRSDLRFDDGAEAEFDLRSLSCWDVPPPPASVVPKPFARDAAKPAAPVEAAREAGAGVRWRVRMDWRADHTPPSPVRLAAGMTMVRDFDTGFDGVALSNPNSNAWLFRMERQPGSGNSALRVLNRVCGSDFGVNLAMDRFSAGEYPLLKFMYATGEWAHADFQFKVGNQVGTIGFTDVDPEGNLLGTVAGVVKDGAWHEARVDLVGAVGGGSSPDLAKRYDVTQLALGDWDYTSVPPGVNHAIDELQFVRVIRTRPEFWMQWSATDPSGIDGYSYAWAPQALDDLDMVAETAEDGAAFKELPDGEMVFHIRARDRAGNWGPIARFPFLIDNTAPEVAAVQPPGGSGAAASVIQIAFKPGVARVDPGGLELFLNGSKCITSPGTTKWDDAAQSLSWDMVAARRGMVKPVPDGTEMAFRLTGIRDFAKNEAPALEWNWRLDYAKDKEGPVVPRVACWRQDRMQYDDFSAGVGPWRVQGQKQSTQAETITDPESGDMCLQVSKIGEGQKFGLFRHWGNTPLAETPVVSFDYKVMPDTKIDLLLNVGGTWHAVVLTGGGQAPVIGRVEDAKADGQWRHATIDVETMVKTALPDLKEPRCQNAYLGEWQARANKVGACFRVDNFAIVGPGSPVPRVYGSAADVSGIAAWEVGLDRDPRGRPNEEQAPQSGWTNLPGVDEAGMWFFHVRARDGAGNWGQSAHFPYLCTEPFAVSADDGWEAEPGWAVAVRRGAKVLPDRVSAAATATGRNRFLNVELVTEGKGEMEVSRAVQCRVGPGAVIVADLFHDARDPLPVSGFVVPEPEKGQERGKGQKQRKEPAPVVSKRVEVPGGKWTRGVRFELPIPAAPATAGADMTLQCQQLGFLVGAKGRQRASLVLDNVRVEGIQAQPAAAPDAPAK